MMPSTNKLNSRASCESRLLAWCRSTEDPSLWRPWSGSRPRWATCGRRFCVGLAPRGRGRWRDDSGGAAGQGERDRRTATGHRDPEAEQRTFLPKRSSVAESSAEKFHRQASRHPRVSSRRFCRSHRPVIYVTRLCDVARNSAVQESNETLEPQSRASGIRTSLGRQRPPATPRRGHPVHLCPVMRLTRSRNASVRRGKVVPTTVSYGKAPCQLDRVHDSFTGSDGPAVALGLQLSVDQSSSSSACSRGATVAGVSSSMRTDSSRRAGAGAVRASTCARQRLNLSL